jgi:hypothetical protein
MNLGQYSDLIFTTLLKVDPIGGHDLIPRSLALALTHVDIRPQGTPFENIFGHSITFCTLTMS